MASQIDLLFIFNKISLYIQNTLIFWKCSLAFFSSLSPWQFSSVQFSSFAQSCLTPCDPMNRSTPGLPVHHQLPEFTQTHVHWVGDAIQPSRPLSSPSPPAPTLPASGSFPVSRLFASDSQSMGASASVLPMNVQGWFPLGLTGLISLQSKGL